ncbi:MAG: chromate transporter [Clostridiales bacterium]|nr:chromate transporter [Clostridiales bacterium]
MKVIYDIFIAFFRTGLFGFGGGLGSVPLIQQEAVERYHWLTIEEFIDANAFSNSLPGPIATKLSALIGYKVAGFPGMIAGLIGAILPSTVLVIVLMTFYLKYRDQSWLQGMMKAVRPVVVILIFQVVLLMSRSSFSSNSTYFIAAASVVLVYYLNVHPAAMIVLALIFGGIFLR